MVALGRVAIDLLLIREIVLAAEEIEIRHRGGGVGLPRDGGLDDAQARAQGDRISQDPVGPAHRGVNIGFRPHESQVHRVTQEAVGGLRACHEVIRHVQRGEQLVKPGERQIGEHEPEGQQQHNALPRKREAREEQGDDEPERQQQAESGEHAIQHRVEAAAGDSASTRLEMVDRRVSRDRVAVIGGVHGECGSLSARGWLCPFTVVAAMAVVSGTARTRAMAPVTDRRISVAMTSEVSV